LSEVFDILRSMYLKY